VKRRSGDARPGRGKRLRGAACALIVLGWTAAAGGDAQIGGRIKGDARLSGIVQVKEDLLVLPGASLELAPGTILVFAGSESSKVEPESFLAGTELVVRGRLAASGAEFRFPERSGGIVVDGGRARLSDCRISGAETGIAVTGGGTVEAAGTVRVRDCRVGAALFPFAASAWEGGGEVVLERNGIGAVRFPGAPPLPATFSIRGSEEADRIVWEGDAGVTAAAASRGPSPGPRALRLGDTFLEKDLALSGDVVVDGVVRVGPGARLSIAPGTRLFFTFRDTDGDGIGENGLFLQGSLDARGTKEKPIGFYPDDGGGRGRWDSVNFMASDQRENVLEHVEIVGAYRGLHAHFSRLRGRRIRISSCYRGVQFQESDVELSGVEVVSTTSLLRCRDSNVRIDALVSRGGVSGANFLRSAVRLVSPSIEAPGWYGLRFRESRAEVSSGSVRDAYMGISVQEGTLRAERLEARDCGLAGFAVLDGNVSLDDCALAGSRLDALEATRGTVSVSGGSLAGAGRYAVKLGGPARVALRGVDAGAGKGRKGRILDGASAPGLGVVLVE
jgi:hypothetical protein